MIDATAGAIQAALDGLGARQRAIAANIANAETPGYLASRVSFEDSLRGAMRNGERPESVSPSITSSSDATNTNGNNVHLDDETVALTETGLRYQLMIEAMNSKIRILRSAIGGP